MAPKQGNTLYSSSGRVEYAITNHVAFMDKESVHEDFHPLMDFLKNSLVSYALTASPTIYAEVVEEMWSTACSSEGHIKLKIKGKSYIITPSVINQALHLPNCNFENLPTDEEIIVMLYSIKYASKNYQLGQVNRKYLRKEWSYFFDTLTKVFTGKCGGYDAIIKFIQKIAYSLMYNRTIDIGSLLLNEFTYKLGDVVKRSKIIYYARFLMIIANHLCKELVIDDRDDTLQVFVQSKVLFSNLVKNNFHAKVKLVLPKHIQLQLSTLSSSPSHTSTTSSPVPAEIDEVRKDPRLPSQSQSGTKTTSVFGKRKKTTLPTIIVDGDEENDTTMEANPPQKKMNASVVKPELRLHSEDPEKPPGFFRDGVPVVEIPSSPEEEKPNCDLRFVLEPILDRFSQEEMSREDRQHLVNAAFVLKSQLVARLTNDADKLSTEDKITLANRCFYALRELKDDYTSFSSKVNKLIEGHEQVESIARKKINWNDRAIRARYIQQETYLCNVSKKLSSAEDKLSEATTNVGSLKFKREELTGALLKLTNDLYEEEERVKILTAERDRCKEAQSDAEAKLRTLEVEKEEGCVALKAINDQYNAAKEKCEKLYYQLLQLVRKR